MKLGTKLALATGAAGAAVVSASMATAEPSEREIERTLGCRHGMETREWNASEGAARQDGITVRGIGGQLNILRPGANYGESYQGRVGFGIRGNGSVKAWQNEGFNIDVPGRGNGLLTTVWSDVDAGDTLHFDDWGQQAVRNISGYVGEVSGQLNGDDVTITAGATSTALSEVRYYVCEDAPRNDGDGGTGGGKSESGLSGGDVDGGTTSLNFNMTEDWQIGNDIG